MLFQKANRTGTCFPKRVSYRQGTMKETLLLLQGNGTLKDILGICSVPSPASVSRLSRRVEMIVKVSDLHERVISLYTKEVNRMVSHLSIDSTSIESREKPYRKKESASIKPALTNKRRNSKTFLSCRTSRRERSSGS